MGCQDEVILGNNLTFTITTHDPDTGVLTDADAPPVYRVYEDEGAVPVLNGVMAGLDVGNTTGFYSELLACTAANGFELNKSYSVYVSAIVGGDTGGMTFGFTPLLTYDVLSIGPELRAAIENLPDPRAADIQLPVIQDAQEL